MKHIFTLCLLAFLGITILNAQAPVITSFSPLTGKPGDAITLTGTGFNTTAANNVVFCGATKATVTAATATSVTITVPSGATYDYITLLNAGTGLAANSKAKFTPTYSPAKGGFTTSDLEASVDFPSGTNPYGVAIADLDGDGKPDLVVVNSGSNTVSVYRNISTPGSITTSSFAAKVDFATGTRPYGVAFGDLDGDGKPDLAVANNGSQTISLFRNTASSGIINSSSFAAKVDVSTPIASNKIPTSVAIGDLDGDGKLDLVVPNIGNIAIIRNISTIGSFNFNAAVDIATSTLGSISVVIADFNNDGKPDIASAGRPISGNFGVNFTCYLNASSIGSISFTLVLLQGLDLTSENVFGFPLISRLSAGDLDGDGKIDLTLAMYPTSSSAPSYKIYRNISTTGIAFATPLNFSTAFGRANTSVPIADLDGDGKLDLVTIGILNSDYVLSVRRNISTVGSLNAGSFDANVNFSVTSTSNLNRYFFAIGDLDGDGRPDVVTSNNITSNISIYRNADPISIISSNANLNNLTISSGTLSPAFASATTTYTASTSASNITVTPTIAEANATIQVRVNGGAYAPIASGSASNSLALNIGSNTIDVLVTAQDGTTTKTYTTTVTRTEVATATITANGPTTFCAGGSVILTANAGASYLWSNNETTQSITVTASGSYSVAVTTAGGSTATSAATSVTVNPLPTASITASGATTFCSGGNVTLTASAGDSYSWSNGATTQSVNVTTSGNYSVTVTTNGCSATSAATSVIVNNCNLAGALNFDGVDDYVSVNNTLGNFGTSDFTIEMKVKTATSSIMYLVSKRNVCSNDNFISMQLFNGNRLDFEISDGNYTGFSTSGAPNIADNNWHHVAVTRKGRVIKLFVDGIEYATTTAATIANISNTYTLTMGSSVCNFQNGSVLYNGSLDEIRFWNRAICQGELQNNMNCEIDGIPSTLKAYYKLNQGSVNADNTSFNNVIDATGTNDGTLVNFARTGATSNWTTGNVSGTCAPFVAPTASISASGATTFCTGGSVTLTANSGSSYLWSNGATTQAINVTASGNYSVTVTTNGCSATSAATSVTVNPLPTPTITASGPTTFCSGGSVTLTASAGSTYLWNITLNDGSSYTASTPSINVTASSSVSVSITNGTCSATSAVTTVTVNPLPVATITASGATTFCSGGSVTLTSTAGSSYLWSNGATTQSINVTTSGNYSVTVTTNGCSAISNAVTVTVNTPPTVFMNSNGSFKCEGETFNFFATPAGLSYAWTGPNGFTSINQYNSVIASAATAGTYEVFVTDVNGCRGRGADALIVKPKPVANITANGATTFCAGGSITLTASAADSYSWSNGATTQSINVTASGNYSVTVTTNGCSATSAAISVTVNPLPTITCPSNVSVNATTGACGAIVNYSNATATGTPTPTITYSHDSGSFFPVGITPVTATASNSCGTVSCTFTVTVNDNQFPVLISVPANATVECNAVPAIATVTATDNCTTSVPTYTETRTNGNCPSNYTLIRTWSTTDASNNTTTASQTITVQDTQAPVLSAAPANTTVECNAVPAAAILTATDNCDNAPTVTYAEVRTNGNCPSNYTLTRTWTATDACGNTSSKTQTITVQDTQAPVLSAAAANTTVECNAVPAAAVLTATDNCDNAPTVTYAEVRTNGNCPSNYTLTRTWTATDVCNNSSSKTQTIIVQDTQAPTLSASPANTTVECNAVPAAAVLTATDNCDNAPTVTFAEVRTNGNCPSNYALTRTWTATDACSNSSSKTQTIIVQDTQAPTLSAAPANTTVECNAVPAAAVLTATDNCDNAPIVTYAEVRTNGNCPSNYTLTRTWTATDVCNNSSSKTQTIIVQDTQAPTLSAAPASVTVECNAVPAAAVLTATDNCDNAPTVTYAEVRTNGNCPSNYTLTRTWTAVDACGNTSSKSQVITVQDTQAPVLSAAPNNATVSCNAITAAAVLTATDNCDNAPSVTYTQTSTQNANAATVGFYNYALTRIWTATDACGNASSKTQIITVQDVTAPVITCPSNAIVNCQDNNTSASTGVATATDNCAPVANIAITQTQTSTQDPNPSSSSYYNYVITRTWKATDVAGNFSTCVQTITVRDTTKPIAVCQPVTVTLVGGSASITASQVNNGSFDNCGSPLTYGLSKSTFNCTNFGSNTVTLTVTDVSGNSNTCTAVVKVEGEIPTCSIASIPTSTVFTGGVSTNLYLGYGAQSTTLQVSTPASGSPYTYSWTGTGLNNYNTANPVFTPTTAGNYVFTVLVKNKYGCTSTCTISICVTDIRVPGTDGKKVYVCHLPSGNTANAQTLSISVNAVSSHVGQHGGDRLGNCQQQPCYPNIVSRAIVDNNNSTDSHFNIKVLSNPTNSLFTIKLDSKSDEPIVARAITIFGQQIELIKGINSNSNLVLGEKWNTGVYLLELAQGNERKVVKLIKL